MKFLISLLLLPAVFSIQWFDCEPSFFYTETSRTIERTSPLSEKAREISREYHSNRIKEVLKKRATSFKSRCTIMRAPANHDLSNNTQYIDVFLKCYSKNPSSTGQMWFIQGGPGASSIAMEGFMSEAMERVGDTYDACTFDFRGVFRSNGLYCYANQAETPGSKSGCSLSNEESGDCRKGIEISYSLSDFTTTQAAKDIKMAIDAVGKPNIVLYGVSYGTYLLGRFTQIYPNIGKVLIFDSVANLAGDYLMTFDKWDEVNDNVLNELLKLCKADSFCMSKLGSDPKAFAIRTLDNVFGESSTCPQVKKIYTDKASFIGTMQGFIQDLLLRPLFTTFLYRMNRCSNIDVSFISALSGTSSSENAPSYCSEESSDIIYNNVGLGELWNDALTEQNILDKGKSLDFNGGTSYKLFKMREAWSSISRKDYYNQKLSPSGKVLVLQSELDPQTPLVSAKSFFNFLNVTTNQAYLGIAKGGVHVTANTFVLENDNILPCGFDIMFNFVKQPNQAPDFSCLDKTFTDDFEGEVLAFLLGIRDLYESKYSSASMILPGGLITLISIFLLFF